MMTLRSCIAMPLRRSSRMCMEVSDMKDQCQTIMNVMNKVEGVHLREKHGGHFRFRFHMTEKMSEVGLEALDLSVRSYNCLKRAGYNTVGDVFDGLASGKELRSIRNCGTTSAREIMEKLFLFQYESLSEKNREWYLLEVVVLNAC
ncbi:MAG: hypothetical protein E7271_09595 [Lachnospiraceae bacterium]|nr:hypothetical protein [Lachnospiraceae bacterium]